LAALFLGVCPTSLLFEGRLRATAEHFADPEAGAAWARPPAMLQQS
jgi:hypothetical protein